MSLTRSWRHSHGTTKFLIAPVISAHTLKRSGEPVTVQARTP